MLVALSCSIATQRPVVKDLGTVVNSSIRLKHSVDDAKPQYDRNR
ncbi:S-layer y domain ribonuclease [Bacillus thuringiensis IBL 200]|nr:hypothetical protein [Bacillus thuringiensis]EEM95403.1 S-layer y domain ribonuclease [Bacillus thuringiensis IBL 200]MED3217103.1 hypothetical protein [Bacillus thuringiensis]